MQLGNSADRYGVISIVLHWAGALSVLAMLTIGALAWAAPDRPARTGWLILHGSVGMALYLLIAARIVAHFVQRQPRRLSTGPRLDRLAATVQLAMLGLVALQLITGPIDIWSGGWPISVFGWFKIASPLGGSLHAAHDAIGDFHRYCAVAIGALIALHVAGALKHLLIDRDKTVQRMLGLAQ